MKKIIACISIICYTLLCYSQNQATDHNYRTQKNISYLHPGEKDSYKLERCKLDLYYPTDKKGFATLVWFHGGGLEACAGAVPRLRRRAGDPRLRRPPAPGRGKGHRPGPGAVTCLRVALFYGVSGEKTPANQTIKRERERCL